ncbi:hypothetical protein EV191_103135 [Tamaricihabitans halophyticus]|uniref:Uncharacterized protein n=1 Tax=Tamaricihabitans halophyticus TaxID=1262583 RepID=A0A4R2QXM1_9PSEU|nr:hypothetical protein EV191_103135 [Tamaricihabitans halophyticus]
MTRKKRAASEAAEHAVDEPRITPAKAKNYLKVAKVLGPAVIPVLAPLAVQAAGVVRDRYDRYRAHQLGVPVERLAEFTGRGAALHARIAGIGESLTVLRDSDAGLVDQRTSTLRQLAAAVRAAERMPTARRKAAHRAVAAQLDELESELLHRFGVQ